MNKEYKLYNLYKAVIEQLRSIYDDHKVINEYEEHPVTDITTYLQSLELESTEDNEMITHIAIRRYIKNCNCFKWRFLNKNSPGDVWNPLYEPYETFQKRAKNEIEFWYDKTPYPSEEIIENWIKSYVDNSSTQKIIRKPSR